MAAILMQTQGSSSLRPAGRDERSCVCSGRVQEINVSGAWILPNRPIDHAAAWKNQGSIHLDLADISPGVQLQSGDSVIFYLYATESGLGAQDCCLKSTFVMNLSEKLAKAGLRRKDISHAWVLDESDGEEESGSTGGLGGIKASSDTDSTGFASEESESSDDETCEEELEGSICCEPCGASAGPLLLPSLGSSLHASGKCKPCGFFMWGECDNGEECGKCHIPHASKFSAFASASDEAEAAEDAAQCDRNRTPSSRNWKTIAETAPMFAAMLLEKVGTPPGLELAAI